MGKFITIIQGHPDAQTRHFCHALADEYAKGCEDGGHEVRRIEVARLEFPLLRTKDEFEKGTPPDSIKQAQDAIHALNALEQFLAAGRHVIGPQVHFAKIPDHIQSLIGNDSSYKYFWFRHTISVKIF